MKTLIAISALAAVAGGAFAQTNLVDSVATDPVDNISTNPVDSVATNSVDSVATDPVDSVATDPVDSVATDPVDNISTNPVDSVATNSPTATDIREQGTDEIDLEEIDDSAEANAMRPTVKADGDSVEYVDISCDEATLADILRQFRKTTKANIISDDSTNLQKRVSAELRHVPWLDALQSILNSRGFRLEKRGDIHFVNEQHQEDPIFTRPFQLNHASADDMAKLFNESYGRKDNSGKLVGRIANSFPEANVVVVTATEKVLRDCEAIIRAVDKAVAQIYIEARFLELSSSASHALGLDWSSLSEWGLTLSNLKAGFGHAEGDPANYGVGITTRSLTSNGNGSKTVSDTTSSSSTTTTSSDSTTYTGLFPSTIGSAANAALSAEDMAWRDAFGYSGQISASSFSLMLSAFEALGEGKIFSNPKIIVANGKEATVDMTTKEPNVTVEANYTGTSSQNMNISTKLETIPGTDKQMFAGEAFFSYGITLSVKPRISPDGLINVEIVPTISEKTGDKEVKGATAQSVYTTYPTINVKRLTTNFTMKDGATAVIGGLTRTTEEDVDDGIPYLRKIPWIGPRLFGRITRSKEQSEIIVFVTVGIANPQELPKDIGLPTNAVIGREYVEGKRLEPGQRRGCANEVFAVDTRPLADIRNDKNQSREIQPADEPRGTVTVTPSASQEQ